MADGANLLSQNGSGLPQNGIVFVSANVRQYSLKSCLTAAELSWLTQCGQSCCDNLLAAFYKPPGLGFATGAMLDGPSVCQDPERLLSVPRFGT